MKAQKISIFGLIAFILVFGVGITDGAKAAFPFFKQAAPSQTSTGNSETTAPTPEIQAATEKVNETRAKLDQARKQLNAAKAALKAADAEFRAAQANVEALSLRKQAQELADATRSPIDANGVDTVKPNGSTLNVPNGPNFNAATPGVTGNNGGRISNSEIDLDGAKQGSPTLMDTDETNTYK
jgi:Tfp pilus assembly protein FimV